VDSLPDPKKQGPRTKKNRSPGRTGSAPQAARGREQALPGQPGEDAGAGGFFSTTDTTHTTPARRHLHPGSICCAEEDHGQTDEDWTEEDDAGLEVGSHRHKCLSVACFFFLDDVLAANSETPNDKAARWALGGVKEAHKNTEPRFCYIGAFARGLPRGKGVFVFAGGTIFDGV
jgi:hypothetical protein